MTLGFLSLPGEIRNLIYEYLLVNDEPIDPIDHPVYPLWPQAARPTGLSPNVLSTHSVIHREGRDILYGRNKFDVSFFEAYSPPSPVTRFLDKIGRHNAARIRWIRIAFPALNWRNEGENIMTHEWNEFLEKIASCCTDLETVIMAECRLQNWQRFVDGHERFHTPAEFYANGIGAIDFYLRRISSLSKIIVEVHWGVRESELGMEMKNHGWILEDAPPDPCGN